jgi:hypothetical protein
MLNVEVKGNLARLLATENLIVEHRPVETAMFNVKDRILTLPMWEKASANVYDMLVGHEVGHAIYTPDRWGDDYGIPQSYLNVCEDARIEKLMKRKFPGLARNFYAGYKELADQDFFCIGDRGMDTYTLIDRINLYFKIGIHAGEVFQWNPEEKALVDMVANAETFDEVVEVARKILEYTKEQEQQQMEMQMEANAQQGDGAGDSTQGGGDSTQGMGDGEGQTSGDGTQSQGDADGDQPQDSGTGSNTGGAGSTGGLESETDKAFTENQKQLVDQNRRNQQLNYIELPNLSVKTLVIDNKTVMEDCKECFGPQSSKLFAETDRQYQTFRAEAQREVNYLVKEFEMRKSADQYARASTAKTGILDTQKLHTFKWNEDVFKKINVVPDGKNHGLIFILDWSGSMGGILQDTAKQLLNLAWFCKKVQIPFDILAFSNDYWYHKSYDYYNQTRTKSTEHQKKVVGQVEINSHFRLLNLVSSNGRNGKDLEAQLKNFWRLVDGNSRCGTGFSSPPGYSLSGTPLHEAAISLTAVIPDFQKRNKVQKTNVIILTDGESAGINYFIDRSYGGYGGRIGTNHVGSDCVLRDRKTGRVYPRFDDGGYYGNSDKITRVFLQNVRDRFPDVNLIGIRLVNGRGLNTTYGADECKTPYDEIQKQWKKNKSAELVEHLGYQALYLMATDALSATTQFDVAEDASEKEIGQAFTKALAKKGVNKKMLTSFATLIS